MTAEPHSQRHFTDARDHWWNHDYLGLIAHRLGLGAARRVLDVGAGQGHFGRAWAPWLHPEAEVLGVDLEARSLEVARARAPDARFSYRVGDATALPFADDGFDFVCCQTLLIHLRDPAAAVAEMVRVTRPGGVVLVAEPNNLGNLQRLAAGGPETDLDLQLAAVRFHLRVVRGKHRLGLGWNDLGVRLPTLLAALEDIHHFGNDRAWVLAPPYASAQESSAIADLRRDVAEGVYGWPRAEARGYYLAGGGTAEDFETDYETLLRGQAEEGRAVDAGTWVELSAGAFLVAAGRKPVRGA